MAARLPGRGDVSGVIGSRSRRSHHPCRPPGCAASLLPVEAGCAVGLVHGGPSQGLPRPERRDGVEPRRLVRGLEPEEHAHGARDDEPEHRGGRVDQGSATARPCRTPRCRRRRAAGRALRPRVRAPRPRSGTGSGCRGRRAPSARLIPISLRRSLTEMSMTFITPTPPMISEMLPMAASSRAKVCIWRCICSMSFCALRTRTVARGTTRAK